MTLVTGTLWSDSENWVEDPLERGLKLILVQSGELSCRIPGHSEQSIKGPSLCTIVNDGEFTSSQIYGTTTPLRYTIVQLDLESLDRHLGLAPRKLLSSGGGDPYMMVRPAPRAMQALATQIATCPMQGPSRSLYLGGKALELTALSAQFLLGERGQPEHKLRITSSDVERVHAARGPSGALAARTAQPERPGQSRGHEPAQTDGGVSQSVRYQRVRLPARTSSQRSPPHAQRRGKQCVYRRLRRGIQPGAFSIAFRKRYGVSPSEIR